MCAFCIEGESKQKTATQRDRPYFYFLIALSFFQFTASLSGAAAF